ncbi:unnamed protein product [marine sediment metagenome]|uniref:Uncharacterized protein n=1 Tax=marine sediment metagenome TaxID=412755 RepID=X1HU24_9ZZZZ
MDGKVKGTTGALTLEMVKIEELKMLPSNAKIHSQEHIYKIVRLNMKVRKGRYFLECTPTVDVIQPSLS